MSPSGKQRVAIVFGGRSAEHEISLLSAQNIVQSLDTEKYDPVLIGIDREGRWFLNEGSMHLLHATDPATIRLADDASEIALQSTGPSSQLVKTDGNPIGGIDVLFPVMHGPYGEDGTIQGLAKLADVAFVGAGVLGSAAGMDKDVANRLLRDAGIPVAPFVTIRSGPEPIPTYEEAAAELGARMYVKPANLGSSVGISRVETSDEFVEAVEAAFAYDRKVIVEQEIRGREIEVSILGNDAPIASIPGEIIPADGFYSYAAKYLDENGAILNIPADVTDAERETIQATALKAFRVLECAGMARVDGFLTAAGVFYINEINTIPGFTSISMYPKLFEASGIPQSELIDRLIELAIERHEEEKGLKLKP